MGKTTTLVTAFMLFFILPQALAYEFTPNNGQWKGNFLFKTEIPQGALYLEKDAFTYHFTDYGLEHVHGRGFQQDLKNRPNRHHAVRMAFIGSNEKILLEGLYPAKKYYNFFLGIDESQWKGGIHPFKAVQYKGLYDGIDLFIRDDSTRLKYEYHLQPGADASIIQLAITGADEILLRNGMLEMRTSIQDIQELRPFAYQVVRGKKSQVPCEFRLEGNILSYHFPMGYNTSLPLVIDPEIIFSTYSGSAANNFGFTATYDRYGYLYSGGIAFGNGYPVTTGAYQDTARGGVVDISISKYDSSGTFLVYSTYIGGSADEMPHSLVVGKNNELYMLGTSGSDDYPVTNGAFDRTFSGGPQVSFQGIGTTFMDGVDMIITRFNSNGTGLLASTFLGGTETDGLNVDLAYNYADEVRGEIELDNEGKVYIASCTRSTDFPVKNAAQPTNGTGQDGCVVKMDENLSSVMWATYLGGNLRDAVYSVAITESNDVYVCGGTNSGNFPLAGNSYDASLNGGQADAFVAHFSSTGTYLAGSYYGTNSYDQAFFVELDQQGHPHLLGQTEHDNAQLIFNAGYFDNGGGQFVVKFNHQLSNRLLSTQFGSTPGQPNISPTAFLVDLCNSMYIAGWGGEVQTFANNNASSVIGLDVTSDAFQSTPDATGSDFYLMVLSSDANSLLFGSFYGGDESEEHVDGGTSRFDRKGKIYQAVCAGCGGNDDFPIEPDPGAVSVVNGAVGFNSQCNNAVFKVDFLPPIVVADFEAPVFGCAPLTVNFENLSKTFTTPFYNWSFDDGSTSTSTNPSHTYTDPGVYNVMLVIIDNNSCNGTDTIFKEITVKADTAYTLPTKKICRGNGTILGPGPSDFPDEYDSFSWSPSTGLNNIHAANPIASPEETTTYQLTIHFNGCREIITQTVEVDNFPLQVSTDTVVCSGFVPFTVTGSAFGMATSYTWSDDPEFSNILSTDSTLTIDGQMLSGPVTPFYFRASKGDGCSNWDTLSIALGNAAYTLTADTSICLHDSLDIVLKPIYPNEFEPNGYYWAENSLANYPTPPVPTQIEDSSTSSIRISPLTGTNYFVRATSLAGCPIYDSIRVDVSQLDRRTVIATAEKDSAYIREPIQLHGEPSGPFDFAWSSTRFLDDFTSADPVSRPTESIVYTWTVSDPDYPACSFKDNVSIRLYEILCGEPEIFVPTGFSPNLDNVNDVAQVHGRNIRTLDFAIYNRWGEQVFRTSDQKVAWDGTFKGKAVAQAVYVYHLKATCVDGQSYETEGNITVLK